MKIIQLTDTHLMPSGVVVNGVDPEKQLRAAADDILEKHADADLMVITGDLCNYGDLEAYEMLRDILAPMPFEVRLMLGNHDDRRNFKTVFPHHPSDESGYIQSYMDTDFGRLLFLDSHEHGMIGGMYGEDRLAWLDAALAGAGDLPVTVFIHHPPIETGLAHFEKIGMHDDGAIMLVSAGIAPACAISSSATSTCHCQERARRALLSVPAKHARIALSPISPRQTHFGRVAVPATGS